MNATLTELRRQTGRLLSAVLHRNKTVRLTQHGVPVADLTPRSQPLTGEEFAKLWRTRPRLEKGAAEEVLRNIQAARNVDALPD